MKIIQNLYKNPYLQLVLLIIIILLLSLLYTYATKREAIITIKEKKDTYISSSRYTASNNYMIIDTNNNYYVYDYAYLLQAIGLQKKRYADSFDLKNNDKIKITYYGIFQKYLLDFEKI
jgi:hypothetical protein